MTPKCSTKGCWRPATYEIEIRGPGADHSLYYCCNEHLPPPGALIPGVDRVRRRPTARNILNYREEVVQCSHSSKRSTTDLK